MRTTDKLKGTGALIAASVFLLASACTDTLGPGPSQNNIDQGAPTYPAVSKPTSSGFSDGGAGDDAGTSNPKKEKVAAE